MLLPLLMNLDMFSAGAVATPDAADKGRDAGSGKRWWEGEWIIPGVTHYLPEKPPEDIVPLRPKVDAIKERMQAAKPPLADPEYRKLLAGVAGLYRSLNALESRARAAIEQQAIDRAVQMYRAIMARAQDIERAVIEAESREARRKRIVADDEQVIQLLAEILT